MSMDRGARPGTLIPIWWRGTADGIPRDLLQRAQAVLIEDGHFGVRATAEQALEKYAAGGGRVLLDAHGASASLSALWPVESATDEGIDAWRPRASTAARVQEFSPARYDEGPWGAPIGTTARPDARVLLDQDGRPLVARRSVGAGSFTWIGGNLIYHAKAYGNDVEAAFLVDLFGGVGADRSVAGAATLIDPERSSVRVAGASGVFVSQSYHPKWTARWSDGSSLSVYYAGPGLTYVPTPSDGALTLELGRSWSDFAVWALVVLGLVVCAWPRTAQMRAS
jgi:hypothetical protein